MKNIDFSLDEILAWEPRHFNPIENETQKCADNGCHSCRNSLKHRAMIAEQIRAFFASGRRTLLDILESELDDEDKRWVLDQAKYRKLILPGEGWNGWNLDRFVFDLKLASGVIQPGPSGA